MLVDEPEARDIHVFSDSLEAINILLRDSGDGHLYRTLLEETWQHLHANWYMKVRHAQREILMCVDKLAREAHSDDPHILFLPKVQESAVNQSFGRICLMLKGDHPHMVDQPPSPIRREELWLYIRQKPSGAYTSEKTRVVAERIEDLKKKEAEGSFASDGRNDVLTAATGKPDHSGRVKQYFDVESMLLPGKEVTSPCVQIFMKCMHEKLVQQGRISDFGFLCPVYATTTGSWSS
ncbi:hypothetical protein K1719_044397 [Acacia pycnantha]|nr:hypothetical protein K1719_044397 [Acacia pycnantha]